MKKTLFILAVLFVTSMTVIADVPPPPPPPSGGSGGNPIGGGTPVGSGLTFFLLLGAGYGIRKIYKKNSIR